MRIVKTVFFLLLLMVLSKSGHSQNPPITPAWAFKHVVWEDSINTSHGVLSLVQEYLKRDIPVGAVIVDSPWSNSYNDFNWDKTRYPDHENMIRHFKDRDIKVILWLTGAINTEARDTRIQKSVTYDYAVSKKFGLNNSKPGTWWKGKGIHLDFTNEAAKKWWFEQLDKVFVDGVYGWKVDQAEFWFGDSLKTSRGTMSNEQFRPYYYDAMYDYTISRNPAGINMSRPYSHQGGLFASVEKMNLGWCGDFSGDWKGMKLQIDNVYKSAEKGYGAPGCEVAGFFMKRSNKEQFIRYSQFGAMTATMINGGENGAFSNHLPWYHGEDAEAIYRFCVVLHDQLIPYMFSTVVDAHLKGGSLIKNVSYTEESHQLGNDIFTKIISSEDHHVTFTLPGNDSWVDFWTGQVHTAGKVISEKYPLHKFPLFIRKGSIIPLKVESSLTGIGDATMKGKEVLLLHPADNKMSLTYHSPRNEGIEYDNVTVSFNPQDGRLAVKSAQKKDFALLLRDVDPVQKVSGDLSSWHYNKEKRELQIIASGKTLNIQIN